MIMKKSVRIILIAGLCLLFAGFIVAQNIIKKCDMTGFNDLIIEFLKLDDKGKPIYRFICHYKELLE